MDDTLCDFCEEKPKQSFVQVCGRFYEVCEDCGGFNVERNKTEEKREERS